MTSSTTPLRARTRRLLAAAATTGVTVAALVGLAPAAHAAGYSVAYTGGDGVALRSEPTAGARLNPMVVWRDGTPVTIICQTWSEDGVGPRQQHRQPHGPTPAVLPLRRRCSRTRRDQPR